MCDMAHGVTVTGYSVVKNKNALIYLVTAGLNSAVPFFTLPFLTRALTPEDFGVIATFMTLTMVVATFFRFEINTVVKKLFSQTPDLLTPQFGAAITYTGVLIGAAVVFLSGLYLSGAMIAGVGVGLWFCILLVALTRIPTLTLHNYWHVTRNVMPYVSWSLLALGGTHFLTLGLALTVLPDWRARISVDIFVAVTSLCVALVIMRRKHQVTPIWDVPLFARMVAVAAPIWPGAMVITILFSLDRIVLLTFVPMRDLGIYSVAVQFAAVITLLFTALNPPFEAWAYGAIKAGQDGVRSLFLKKFAQFAGAGFGVVLVMGPLVAWFLPYWVAPEFAQAGTLVIPLMLALCMFGLFRMMNVCLICLDRLMASSALSVVALVLTGGALLVAVPLYGISGAAYGLLIGFSGATLVQLTVILVLLASLRQQ